MMKSDVLSQFPTVKVCTAYRSKSQSSIVNGQWSMLKEVPYDLSDCEAVYEELPGWQTDLSGITTYDALPQTLRDYIAFIERYIGVPITIVSVGPDRNQTIVRN